MLARMALAHSQASEGTTFCAFKDVAPYLPKGCNNGTLGDAYDKSVEFLGSGYSNQALTGSASNLAKTAHNGQNCGVIDLNGNMHEVASGLTNLDSAVPGNVLVLQPTQRLKDLVPGNLQSGTGYDMVNINNIESATNCVRIGKSVNQVFDSASTGVGYIKTSLGLATIDGRSEDGTTEFGMSFNYIRDDANMLPVVGGNWYNVTSAGVFRVSAGFVSREERWNSTVGVRLCRYIV